MTDPNAPSTEQTSRLEDVSLVQLRPPSFWPRNPQVWFDQVDAQFTLELSDVLSNPSDTMPHQHLKTKVLERFMPSERPIRLVLEAAVNLDRLAALADQVHKETAPSINAASPPADTVISHLEVRIDELAASIAALQRLGRLVPVIELFHAHESLAVPAPLCWYRRHFRHRATTCTLPCSWSGNARRDQ
ncbi:hypothetical protein HPB50_004012 [Hyalomma asiaticum]|uniref:Uncharacterized protein n=1 Tax=Hyalomma asiaticum TaxID=266040 RepID=A0ACB7RSJ9_HYAAI|nr:hypothetical protein HPB50_004012 [Hyalomma asiaticum]